MNTVLALLAVLLRNGRGARAGWRALAAGFRAGGVGGAIVAWSGSAGAQADGTLNEFGEMLRSIVDDPMTPESAKRGLSADRAKNPKSGQAGG